MSWALPLCGSPGHRVFLLATPGHGDRQWAWPEDRWVVSPRGLKRQPRGNAGMPEGASGDGWDCRQKENARNRDRDGFALKDLISLLVGLSVTEKPSLPTAGQFIIQFAQEEKDLCLMQSSYL